ncbi:MAG: histidine kinase, partial [Actinomycetota bacterium]|nr:histidine kinase [Actinomycetota bacterium]
MSRTIGKLRTLLPLRELGFAVVLGVCLVLGSMGAEILQGHRFRPLDAGAYLLIMLAAVVTLGPRRTAPVWALTGTMVLVSTYLLVSYPYGPVQLCMMIAMFNVARQRPPRVSLLVCGLAAVAASATVWGRLLSEMDTPVLLALAWMGWIVLPWSLGALSHVLAATRDRARRELVARVALEERMKMAGEVHDVAGHGFAVVAMQAGVALLVFDEQPDQVRKSLEAIQATSVKSLTELRSMLDTFHRGDQAVNAHLRAGSVATTGAEFPNLAGDAGLAGLGELLDQVRAGGLPVELEMENMDAALAEDIDVVAYRVVQESLTNVLRHAGPAKAGIRIVRREGELLVQIVDQGRGSPQDSP